MQVEQIEHVDLIPIQTETQPNPSGQFFKHSEPLGRSNIHKYAQALPWDTATLVLPIFCVLLHALLAFSTSIIVYSTFASTHFHSKTYLYTAYMAADEK